MTAVMTIVPVALAHGASLPKRAHQDDAAHDLIASEDVTIFPGERTLAPTGVFAAIPDGYAGLILPRSGLAWKYGLTVLNAPGLIDPGYRGEVKVLLYSVPTIEDLQDAAKGCRPTRSVTIRAGERMAQLLVVKTAEAELAFQPAPSYLPKPSSQRGNGGFGSTGVA